MSPLSVMPFFGNPLENSEYVCEQKELGFAYPNWNKKWYSPKCRPWFKNQLASPNQTTVSDLYVFSDSDRFGLTECAPILKQRGADNFEQTDFHGAICVDVDPSGPLNEYFPFD